MRSYLAQLFAMLILIPSLVMGCAGIPGNKVNLSEIPEVKSKDIKSLNLSYYFESKDSEANKCEEGLECDFNRRFVDLFRSKNYGIELFDTTNPNGCVIKVSSKNDVKGLLLAPYAWASMLTLFIVPYYVPLDYEAKASLISYPSESSLLEKNISILSNQSQAKPGDYFFDESNRPAKLLKAYELKDKVHEVWSSLWMISWFIVDSWGKGPTPEGAKEIVERNISEALARSIINDASQFEECKKDQPSSPKKK